MVKRLLFISSGLKAGGAEKVLFQIICELKKKNIEIMVVSLTAAGYFNKKLKEKNIPVYEIINSSRNIFNTIIRIGKLTRSFNPDVVQTWMYHADFFGGIAVSLFSKKPIVWGIRNSTLSIKNSSISVQIARALCIPLSHFIPKKIVSCSLEGIDCHRRIGYSANKFVYIPNGIRVKKGLEHRLKNWERPIDIVFVGRYNKQKNVEFFLDVIARLLTSFTSLKVVMIGTDMTSKNVELRKMINRRRLTTTVSCEGFIENIEHYYRNSKMLISVSKFGEAFPNVALEAMNNETIPIFLDVGDAKEIIGFEELILKVNATCDEVAERAKKILTGSERETASLRASLRKRAIEKFDQNKTFNKFIELYSEISKSI